MSVNLVNVYFNPCSDKHHIPHLSAKASNQSAGYREHLIQAQEPGNVCLDVNGKPRQVNEKIPGKTKIPKCIFSPSQVPGGTVILYPPAIWAEIAQHYKV